MNTLVTRVGGACAVLAALAVIPAYLVGSPEAPRTADASRRYFESAASFLTINGSLPMLHVLLFLVFIGSLAAVLWSAAPGSIGAFVAVGAGGIFLTLTAVGLAAEVAVPAAIVSFGDVTITQYAQPFLGLAVWVYHFSQVAAAAMIGATGLVIWQTSVLPRAAAALSILGVVSLLHLWLGLTSAYATLAWVVLIGVVMIVRPPSPASARRGASRD